MFFLLSGEGITDMGVGKKNTAVCEGDDFFVGPMAIIVDQVVEPNHGFSILDAECSGYVSEAYIAKRARELKAAKKKARFPGKKRAKETR
jgi:hypothetical protein